MKKLIFTVALIVINYSPTQAQYSTYYNVDVNQKINANINQNVNINERKTITTIDYGALQLANAQREKNRLESIRYANEQERLISLEVASNPVKAYDYGTEVNDQVKGEAAKENGFKSYTINYKIPHNSLFVQAGGGRYENVSLEGIKTEIIVYWPQYNKNNKKIDLENLAKMEDRIEGEHFEEEDGQIFIHKKEINRTTVFGFKGFKSTLIWEDDYQYTINDNFISFNPSEKNGVLYLVEVNIYGGKKEVTFEELEGRRYYLRQLIEKVISTAVVYDMKY